MGRREIDEAACDAHSSGCQWPPLVLSVSFMLARRHIGNQCHIAPAAATAIAPAARTTASGVTGVSATMGHTVSGGSVTGVRFLLTLVRCTEAVFLDAIPLH